MRFGTSLIRRQVFTRTSGKYFLVRTLLSVNKYVIVLNDLEQTLNLTRLKSVQNLFISEKHFELISEV